MAPPKGNKNAAGSKKDQNAHLNTGQTDASDGLLAPPDFLSGAASLWFVGQLDDEDVKVLKDIKASRCSIVTGPRDDLASGDIVLFQCWDHDYIKANFPTSTAAQNDWAGRTSPVKVKNMRWGFWYRLDAGVPHNDLGMEGVEGWDELTKEAQTFIKQMRRKHFTNGKRCDLNEVYEPHRFTKEPKVQKALNAMLTTTDMEAIAALIDHPNWTPENYSVEPAEHGRRITAPQIRTRLLSNPKRTFTEQALPRTFLIPQLDAASEDGSVVEGDGTASDASAPEDDLEPAPHDSLEGERVHAEGLEGQLIDGEGVDGPADDSVHRQQHTFQPAGFGEGDFVDEDDFVDEGDETSFLLALEQFEHDLPLPQTHTVPASQVKDKSRSRLIANSDDADEEDDEPLAASSKPLPHPIALKAGPVPDDDTSAARKKPAAPKKAVAPTGSPASKNGKKRPLAGAAPSSSPPKKPKKGQMSLTDAWAAAGGPSSPPKKKRTVKGKKVLGATGSGGGRSTSGGGSRGGSRGGKSSAGGSAGRGR